MSSPHTDRRGNASRAFTIIELLTVIAIIGILVAILIPSVTSANIGAKKAKTRVQFSQWATASEGFRQEYGYYPDFTLFTDGKIDSVAKTEQFIQTLTGRKLDGTALVSTDSGAVAGNTKRISFCAFAPGDLTVTTELQDAFGNTQIVVLMDKNFDGLVRIGGATGDYATAPPVNGVTAPLAPGDFVRAGVIFYSAGTGGSTSDIVKSW